MTTSTVVPTFIQLHLVLLSSSTLDSLLQRNPSCTYPLTLSGDLFSFRHWTSLSLSPLVSHSLLSSSLLQLTNVLNAHSESLCQRTHKQIAVSRPYSFSAWESIHRAKKTVKIALVFLESSAMHHFRGHQQSSLFFTSVSFSLSNAHHHHLSHHESMSATSAYHRRYACDDAKYSLIIRLTPTLLAHDHLMEHPTRPLVCWYTSLAIDNQLEQSLSHMAAWLASKHRHTC